MIEKIDYLPEENDYPDIEDFEQCKRNRNNKKRKIVEDYLENRKLKEMLKEDPFYT